jgi:hypothetical protein
MDERVKGSVLKKIGVSLARFAETRETAKEPRDRVVVQANGETVKVVAGASFGTIIATVHATTQQFRAVISAREFLTTCKSLSAKKDYQIVDLQKGFEIGCTLDGKDFLRLSKSLPVIMLPPDISAQSQGSIPLTDGKLQEIGNILPSVTDYYDKIAVAGKIYTGDNRVRFASTNNVRYASVDVPGNYDIFGVVYGAFLDGIRDIGDSVMEFWTDGKVTVENETYRAVGAYHMLEGSNIPLSFKHEALESIKHKMVADRTALVKSIRDNLTLDKHERVVLQLTESGIKVVPFNENEHGWGIRGENLLKILTATKAKQIGIGFREGAKQPINVRIPEWTIEVAPVLLSTSK